MEAMVRERPMASSTVKGGVAEEEEGERREAVGRMQILRFMSMPRLPFPHAICVVFSDAFSLARYAERAGASLLNLFPLFQMCPGPVIGSFLNPFFLLFFAPHTHLRVFFFIALCVTCVCQTI